MEPKKMTYVEKTLNALKNVFDVWLMMVTRQKIDEIEYITKSSHCRPNFYLFISFSEEKTAYVTHTFNNEIYGDLQKSERTSFKIMFGFPST